MFILINKPTGPTSHDIISQLRRITGIKKIGHAGTLDPFASGLLIVAIERESTREIDQFVKLDKEYIATVKLGATSDTYDRMGKIETKNIGNQKLDIGGADKSISNIQYPIFGSLSEEQIKQAVNSFIGPQLQVPPMYSAKKIGGKKLYELARQGKEIDRVASEIEIYSIEILAYNFPLLKILVRCGSGTYIRSLAHDLGQKLGCGAYLEELERTKIGAYDVKDAVLPSQLTPENWRDYSITN